MSTISLKTLEWSTASSPMPGEEVLGDRAVVAFEAGHALTAAVDGVGHGAEAAAAAQAAVSALKHCAARDVASAARECHSALRHTRGVALSLATFDCRRGTMTWLGVGNVEARLLRMVAPVPVAESLPLQRGRVGHQLPQLAPQTLSVTRGDVLIFATDGIRRDFADLLVPAGSCREIAARILERHSRGSDDALVLVARYLGTA